ncbi:MAG TPA: pitrilysin family protein [Phycisphaerae bacterium]|nr:pitrilysin family protein [Phycisphaerae bacterium]
MTTTEIYQHQRLDSGVELAALPIEGRRTTAYEIRILAGLADEPEEKLGLARIVDETIDKGSAKRTAREVSDAFDAIGADVSSGVGRESFVFRCSCLPEYVEQALTLHAEMLRMPVFPEEFVKVALELGQQELTALEDDPGELTRKLLAPHAFGRLLGRHELGTRETLEGITRQDVLSYWRRFFVASRMQMVIAGAVDVPRIARHVDGLFDGFGQGGADGRTAFRVDFSPGTHHHDKELEQQHILMCWPGVPVPDDDYAAERVVLTVLGRGMSSRLFTEVREKQGLVYSVGAWDDHPRGAGMIFIGASTTPARSAQTVRALLREVDRLSEDVTEEELARAKVRIIAKSQTHGDITRARAGELGSDLFHYGRPVPLTEKNERVTAVSVADVRRYLAAHPRDKLCMMTLGPKVAEN